MSTRQMFMYFLLMAVNCVALPAKWTEQENWRKLKQGTAEIVVLKTLGEPKYSIKTDSVIYHCYTTKEPDYKKTPALGSEAWVKLGIKTGSNNIYVIDEIKEPNFNAVKDVQAKKQIKLKPKQKLEKWQNEKSWKKLYVGMSEHAVINMLGEPTIKTNRGTFRYGNNEDVGGSVEIQQTVKDKSNSVKSWKEPIWYTLNKELYDEVEEEEKKTEDPNKPTEKESH